MNILIGRRFLACVVVQENAVTRPQGACFRRNGMGQICAPICSTQAAVGTSTAAAAAAEECQPLESARVDV